MLQGLVVPTPRVGSAAAENPGRAPDAALCQFWASARELHRQLVAWLV